MIMDLSIKDFFDQHILKVISDIWAEGSPGLSIDTKLSMTVVFKNTI